MFTCRSLLNSIQKNARSFMVQSNGISLREFNQSSFNYLKLNQSALLNKTQV